MWPYEVDIPRLGSARSLGYEPSRTCSFLRCCRCVEGGGMHREEHRRVSVRTGSLLNDAPTRATLKASGPPMKVLDDEHSITNSNPPPSGEGRVILDPGANQLKTSDGRFVDSVEVRYDRKLVGRLSTQMSDS